MLGADSTPPVPGHFCGESCANKWRGMLFGMTNRAGWNGVDPNDNQHLWELVAPSSRPDFHPQRPGHSLRFQTATDRPFGRQAGRAVSHVVAAHAALLSPTERRDEGGPFELVL